MNVQVDWKAEAKKIRFPSQAFINGKFVPSASGETFPAISPIDGIALVQVAACDKEDVDRAVKAARAAFNKGSWADKAPKARKKILLKFADLIDKHADELALLETLDVGKPISNARNDDIFLVAECVRFYAEALDKIYDEIAPKPKDWLATITREPIGVCAAVVPWNFPLLMAAWKFAPGLAAGNSMIVKPAEQSPLTMLRTAELAAEAGIPEGVLQVVPGYGETAGQAIGRHMDIDAIGFTGSSEVGKFFLKYSGESNMKIVSLECGGKSPNIVFADAPDLVEVAKMSAGGIFYNSGQVCDAASRLIVEDKVHDKFMDALITEAKTYEPGDPLDPKTIMGSVVDENQMKRVLGYIEKGKGEGATVATGGKRVRENTKGFFVEPTVFDGVKNNMTVAQEEIFGPVLTTISFKTTEEALSIANDTIYGLGATLWTTDLSKAHKTARAIRAGTVMVNTPGGGGIEVPFGGYKQSGFGRDKSLHALEKYTQLKTTLFKFS